MRMVASLPMNEMISADYLVKGTGAASMAFVDSLLSHGDGTVVMVDHHDRPGGHWNDAYSFVRLHQPAGHYGVGSTPLGSGRIDQSGLNAGFYELASGQEVLSHFDQVMRHHFLPSGRVRWFPTSHLDDDGAITSRLSGAQARVQASCFVDGTYSAMRVPSVDAPSYEIDAGVTCVPPNQLPSMAHAFEDYVVVGAGKTGMDACIWLLEQGADPDTIRWIVPRDAWTLNRANFQPGEEFFSAVCENLADQVESVVLAESVDDLFVRLEAVGQLRRIDPTVTPTAYRCAILSDGELTLLRRLSTVVRLGHVVGIRSDAIELDRGSIPSGPRTLHIDCSADGIPVRPTTPVFADGRITLQFVRTCQPTFSSALIGFVESTFGDVELKNRICTPIPVPMVPLDWLRMLRLDLANRATWAEHPEIGAWMAGTRLDVVTKHLRTRLGVDLEATAHLQRYREHQGPAATRLQELLGDEVT